MADPMKEHLEPYRERLTEADGISLYTQIEYILKNMIENEIVPAGTEFLSEEEISRILGTSRPTVNRAVKTLIGSGYLSRERGKKARTNKMKDLPLVFMNELTSFSRMLEQQSLSYSTVLLKRERIQADPLLSRRLDIPENSDVVHLKRIRSVKDEPILLVDSYFDHREYGLLLDLPEEEFDKSLYTILEEHCGKNMVYAEREVAASRMELDDAALLETTLWEPCLLLRAVNYTAGNRPAEYFVSRLKGSRCVLNSRIALTPDRAEQKGS